MGRLWKVQVGILAGALLLFQAAGFAAVQEVRNIVVIGWDGAQRNHLREMIARNEVPALSALAQEGRLIDIDVTTGATDTKAGWTQILTGYAPEKTGVYSNGKYQPIPEGYSVFERLEKQFGKDGIDTVALIGKKAHVDNDPPVRVPYEQWQQQQKNRRQINAQAPGQENVVVGGKVVEENGAKYVLAPGKPWYTASKNMDLFENGLQKNARVTERALEELQKRQDRRFFLFVHFAEPDHAGHASGENSQAYTDAIRDDDACTSRILSSLKTLGLYDKTLVYIVVDHGFNEGQKGHKYAPFVFLATNDALVNRDGNRMDIAPTVLKRFGVDLASLEPKLDGIALDEPAPERRASEQPPALQPGGAKAGAQNQPARAAKRAAAKAAKKAGNNAAGAKAPAAPAPADGKPRGGL